MPFVQYTPKDYTSMLQITSSCMEGSLLLHADFKQVWNIVSWIITRLVNSEHHKLLMNQAYNQFRGQDLELSWSVGHNRYSIRLGFLEAFLTWITRFKPPSQSYLELFNGLKIAFSIVWIILIKTTTLKDTKQSWNVNLVSVKCHVHVC